MKLLILFILISFYSLTQSNYITQIERDRSNKESDLFTTNLILTAEEQALIERLDFFPIDTTWVLPVQFRRDRGKPFKMETTSDRKANYRQEGTIHFTHKNRHYQLTLYKNLDLTDPKYKDYYFLPFKDLSSPNESYGGGRFIEIYMDLSKKQVDFRIDFNTAFNPYCAYSYRFSCPITPVENYIDLKIEAGEKKVILKDK